MSADIASLAATTALSTKWVTAGIGAIFECQCCGLEATANSAALAGHDIDPW